jgi:serine/threonine-protein kinase
MTQVIPEHHAPIGEKIPVELGRYRIVNEIGRGGMGTVYRAFDRSIERFVALKVVKFPASDSLPADHQVYARFLREAKAAGRLVHPNVVTIFDVGEDWEYQVSYIAMEYVEGEPLSAVLERRERLGFKRIIDIGIQVASALEAAHAASVVHRDIKPANLILTPLGRIKIADFGIAKIQGAPMTQDGCFLGSPQYMAPEQMRSVLVDHRADLFSLGVVLYELVTLRPAFSGENTFEIMKKIEESEPEPPRNLRPDLPVVLEAAILKAMAKRPENRFPSATEMLEALEACRPSALARIPSPRLPNVRAEVAHKSLPPDISPGPAAAGSSGILTRARRSSRIMIGPALIALVILCVVFWAIARVPGGNTRESVEQGAAPAPSGSLTDTSVPGDSQSASVGVKTEGDRFSPRDKSTKSGDSKTEAMKASSKAGTAAEKAAPGPRKSRTPNRMESSEHSPAPEAGPRPAASLPASSGSGTNAFLCEADANHKHLRGSCKGVLRIGATKIEYDSATDDSDDRVWAYSDIRISVKSPTMLQITENKRSKKTLGLRHPTYNFTLDEPLPAEGLSLFAETKAKTLDNEAGR